MYVSTVGIFFILAAVGFSCVVNVSTRSANSVGVIFFKVTDVYYKQYKPRCGSSQYPQFDPCSPQSLQ